MTTSWCPFSIEMPKPTSGPKESRISENQRQDFPRHVEHMVVGSLIAGCGQLDMKNSDSSEQCPEMIVVERERESRLVLIICPAIAPSSRLGCRLGSSPSLCHFLACLITDYESNVLSDGWRNSGGATSPILTGDKGCA